MSEPLYRICQLNEIPEVPCPCGQTRRAFTDDADRIASLHLVTTEGEAESHYHKRMTEIYYFLEGEGTMELDGVRHPVRARFCGADQARLPPPRDRRDEIYQCADPRVRPGGRVVRLTAQSFDAQFAGAFRQTILFLFSLLEGTFRHPVASKDA